LLFSGDGTTYRTMLSLITTSSFSRLGNILLLAYKNAPATKRGSLMRVRSVRDDGVDGTNKDPCRREIANFGGAQEGS